MIIAIDYDNTYTAEPMMWAKIIDLIKTFGHEVICVTNRKEGDKVDRFFMPFDVVVYAGDDFKRRAAERAGYSVDIWIDDMPGMIEQARILQF